MEKEHFHRDRKFELSVTICLMHIEQFFATSKARAATCSELLLCCCRDQISLKLLIQD